MCDQPTQLDLFGPPPTALEEWRASFTRREWVYPWESATGVPAGTAVLGWVCPDCRGVAVTGFALYLNHGWDPDVPGAKPLHPCRYAENLRTCYP